MSINAISSVSLYEYYYKINKDEQEKKKSPLADEMRKYGLVPTEDENLNILLLKNAKEVQKQQNEKEPQVANSDRPWADLMYQLNISFNEDPKDDIDDIKDELAKLTLGLDDNELNQEIIDLEDYVERLYINFINTYSSSYKNTTSINMHLNNLAMINQVNLL